jgi:hypothetical protein
LRQARRGARAAHRQVADPVAPHAERGCRQGEARARRIDTRPAHRRRHHGSGQAKSNASSPGQGRQDDGKIHAAGATSAQPHRTSSGEAA